MDGRDYASLSTSKHTLKFTERMESFILSMRHVLSGLDKWLHCLNMYSPTTYFSKVQNLFSEQTVELFI